MEIEPAKQFDETGEDRRLLQIVESRRKRSSSYQHPKHWRKLQNVILTQTSILKVIRRADQKQRTR